MSFDFLVRDDNNFTYRAHVDDDGEISLRMGSGKEIDLRALRSFEALGGGHPYIFLNIHTIWDDILTSLSYKASSGYQNKREELLKEIRKNGTVEKRWVSFGRWYEDDDNYEDYIYEFTTDDLISYIGPAIPYEIRDGYGGRDIIGIAKLIKAIQNPDGKPMEFDMEDGEEWERAKNLPSFEMWASIDRTIYADGQEVFEYPVDFTRKIYDTVTLEDSVDEFDDPTLAVAGSDEIREIVRIFGLKEKQDELNKKARDNVPEIDKPEPDEDGLWGVLYEWTWGEIDDKTGDWVEKKKQQVVSYESEDDARWAHTIASDVIDDAADDNDPDAYVVHRMYPDSDDWYF